jgi:hypothetical protein
VLRVIHYFATRSDRESLFAILLSAGTSMIHSLPRAIEIQPSARQICNFRLTVCRVMPSDFDRSDCDV